MRRCSRPRSTPASATAAALWGDSASGLAVHVLADRVCNYPQGLLCSDPAGSGGALRWLAPLPATLPELALQADLGSAAAVVVWTGRLREAVAARGAHGYRLLLTQAGAAASACLLRAEDAGLAGCLFDGLLPAGRCWPDGPDGFVELALFAVAIGVPVLQPSDVPNHQLATPSAVSRSGNESRDVR